MELTLSLAGILGVLLIGAISPGPSFILVARTAIAVSRFDGLMAALGMGVGGIIFSLVVLLGIKAVFASVPLLYIALKLTGGFYLIYLALRIWHGAKEPTAITLSENGMRRSAGKSFALGLVTQLSNPKTAIVYGGIFAAFLPSDLPRSAVVSLPFLVFAVEAGWYSLVALALSTESSRAAYLRSKVHIDRIAGGVMGLLGLKLVVSVRPTP